MASRTVDGPEDDWHDWASVIAITGLAKNTIRRLMGAGEFPRPREVTPGGMRRWSWRDLLYWELRIECRDRLKPENSESPEVPQHTPSVPQRPKRETGRNDG